MPRAGLDHGGAELLVAAAADDALAWADDADCADRLGGGDRRSARQPRPRRAPPPPSRRRTLAPELRRSRLSAAGVTSVWPVSFVGASCERLGIGERERSSLRSRQRFESWRSCGPSWYLSLSGAVRRGRGPAFRRSALAAGGVWTFSASFGILWTLKKLWGIRVRKKPRRVASTSPGTACGASPSSTSRFQGVRNFCTRRWPSGRRGGTACSRRG